MIHAGYMHHTCKINQGYMRDKCIICSSSRIHSEGYMRDTCSKIHIGIHVISNDKCILRGMYLRVKVHGILNVNLECILNVS